MCVSGTSHVAARGRVGPRIEGGSSGERGVVEGDERQKLGGSKEKEKKSHIFSSDLVKIISS